MPVKSAVPELAHFRPPGFDLRRYDRELRPQSPGEWYLAMRLRSLVLRAVETSSSVQSSGGLDPADRWRIAKQRAQAYLPDVFGEREKKREEAIRVPTNDRRLTMASMSPGPELVQDMSTIRAVRLFNRMRSNKEIVRTSNLMRSGSSEWVDDPVEAGAVKPMEWGVPVISIVRSVFDLTKAVPIEVNLHAPDAEILAAFARWLESARETHGVPQPRPKVLNKRSQAPVITEAMLHDWHRDRILPFLDLYIWNRLHNPPPCEGLWRATTPGRFSHQGATWTLRTKTWMELLEWDDERTWRRDILGKALKLLERPIIDLLDTFARRNSEPPLSKE